MNIFKKLWFRYWRTHLHWHNGKGATPKLDHPQGTNLHLSYPKNLHSICSRCGRAVEQDGQLNWCEKK